MFFVFVKYLLFGMIIFFICVCMVVMGVFLLIVLGLFGVFGVVGINFGIDFCGGIQVDVEIVVLVDEVCVLVNGFGLGEVKIQVLVVVLGEICFVLVIMFL